MAVKVLIKRTLKDGSLKAACQLLVNARSGAMKQPGYISSENLSSIDDSNLIVVASMWQKLEDWERWKNSDTRVENERRFFEILVKPTEYERYETGIALM